MWSLGIAIPIQALEGMPSWRTGRNYRRLRVADTVDLLLGLAVRDHSPLVQARAIESLGKISDPGSRQVLTAATKHESPLVRKAAAWHFVNFKL